MAWHCKPAIPRKYKWLVGYSMEHHTNALNSSKPKFTLYDDLTVPLKTSTIWSSKIIVWFWVKKKMLNVSKAPGACPRAPKFQDSSAKDTFIISDELTTSNNWCLMETNSKEASKPEMLWLNVSFVQVRISVRASSFFSFLSFFFDFSWTKALLWRRAPTVQHDLDRNRLRTETLSW